MANDHNQGYMRPTSYMVRRTLESNQEEGTRFEFLHFRDEPPDKVDPVGEWVSDYEDATLYDTYQDADKERIRQRAQCTRQDVIYHLVVER